MLNTQLYLRDKSLSDIESELHISVRRHPKYPNLVHFKYNQIESPMGNPVVQECRSLILNEADEWKAVSCPFFKFFNYGEGHAPEINWNSASVQEKLDGSLLIAYFYDNQWNVSTSGVPDADTPMPVGNETFQNCFWRVWKQLGYSMPIDINHCYMFELMTPFNRVVVPQRDEKLVLHGARNMVTLQEVAPAIMAERNGWQCVKSFPFTSWDEVMSACQQLNPMEQEGYVVCDSSFNRVKAKSPQYVALHHIAGSFSARRMLEVVMTNEQTEFLLHFADWKPVYDQIKERVDKIIDEAEKLWLESKDIKDQKEFALKVKDRPYSSLIFSMRSARSKSLKEAFSHLTIKRAEDLINLNTIDMKIKPSEE